MPWSGIAAGALGAVGSLIGGGINAHNANKQMEIQKEFAQNGIRWKVADAKEAGIHPLAALGAQTFSYNPVATGDYGVSEALGRMGQGIDRAAHAKALAEERALDADLKKANVNLVNAQTEAVQIQAAASKAALAKTALPPPMPVVNGDVNATNSVKPKMNPYWEHYRNFGWITPVPAGDLKDYASENQLINLAGQLAYADAAWSGKTRPADHTLSPTERSRIKAGLATPRYYPFLGWRVEPSLKHYLLKLAPLLRGNSPMLRSVEKIRNWFFK